VPFLRFSRDKRGYENIYLVHNQNRRGKPPRQRVLYWYRTPPGVRVGRPPFDEEARRRLEAQNPDVTFDWPAIIATPMPPPAENEQWRERRRAERAAKQALRAEEASSRQDRENQEPFLATITPEDAIALRDDTPESVLSPGNDSETAAFDTEPQPGDDKRPTELASEPSEALEPSAPGDHVQDAGGRKRRRRGGRRRRGRHQSGPSPNENQNAAASGPEAENTVGPTDQEHGSIDLAPDSEPADFESNDE